MGTGKQSIRKTRQPMNTATLTPDERFRCGECESNLEEFARDKWFNKESSKIDILTKCPNCGSNIYIASDYSDILICKR